MGPLPSANYFQKSMDVYVLSDLLNQICKVYLDDVVIMGSDNDKFVKRSYGFPTIS